MKVVILAGGLGTRISEESYLKPKPMITIGEQPILWHIMKYYSSFGFHDFVICCGYKGHIIKEYFADYQGEGPVLHALSVEQTKAPQGKRSSVLRKICVHLCIYPVQSFITKFYTILFSTRQFFPNRR